MSKDFEFDAIVAGVGHAGIEAGLALSRLGLKTLMLTISLDNVGYLACNPSIGGTAKGHLVREIDALGGQMGVAADKTLMQLRMLNSSKGFAVQSLRAQIDKTRYHEYMKSVLESERNIQLRQGEIISIEKNMSEDNANNSTPTDGGSDKPLYTVKTRHLSYRAKAVVLCCGVYLKSKIIIGETVEFKGPSSFARAEQLSDSLAALGIELRRFKTGTPARVKRDSIDLCKLELQPGEGGLYSFSALSKSVDYDGMQCYLGYTNERTHDLIRRNLSRTARKLGLSEGAGARYCPSIEDKIERFSKERHQFFLEPEGKSTQEMYIQGVSTSLPAEIQLEMYRTIEGFENVEIMRDAYAIEYDCIDPTALDATLMHKKHPGLFFAGQINGTSGYEEAAAQGLVAGINAAKYILYEQPLVLTRDNSYIGVMLDDLVTKGTDEPYRMMTSRAEYRLSLRQDNADLRLTEAGRRAGLVSDKRYRLYLKKMRDIKKLRAQLGKTVPVAEVQAVLKGETALMSLEQFMRRHDVGLDDVYALPAVKGICRDAVREIYINLRYSGYLEREERTRKEQARLEQMLLPMGLDYARIGGLRLEAAEKLNRVRPRSIGQAARISGVNPADINVLIVRLKEMYKNPLA